MCEYVNVLHVYVQHMLAQCQYVMDSGVFVCLHTGVHTACIHTSVRVYRKQ